MIKVFVALDTIDIKDTLNACEYIKEHRQAGVKLGLEFFIANGAEGVNAVIKQGVDVFLDLKLHDIPNTLKGACRAILNRIDRISIVTFHATAGVEGLKTAKNFVLEEAYRLNKQPFECFGVTILTSLTQESMNQIGYQGSILTQTERLANICLEANFDGIVSSPQETKHLKSLFPNLKILNPGIRPTFYKSKDDQSRTLTPRQAVENGADYLVVGRPITESQNPSQALYNLIQEI